MTKSKADSLVEKADSLLYEETDAKKAIKLYQEAATLYMEMGNAHLAASVLMKIGIELQNYSEFYQEVIGSYKVAAQIYREDGNKESCSHSLLSAGLVAESAGNYAQAIEFFLQAGQGYESVAKMCKANGQFEIAWDNLELACICWKNAIKSAKSTDY
jgi:tetratricopeptide (TPR) repeat protein